MFHPWRALRALAHVTLVWHEGGPAGWTHFPTATISLRRGMTLAERRSTIAHEIEHITRGPAQVGYERREELAVCRAAAKRLITFEALVDAMVWSGDEYELAAELWVDVGTVRDRLRSLSPWESAEISRRMERAELRHP